MKKRLNVGQYKVDVNYQIEVDDSEEASYDGLVSHVVTNSSFVVRDSNGDVVKLSPTDNKIIEEEVEEFLETDALDYICSEDE